MNKGFLPKSKAFWLLHTGAWLSLYLFIVYIQVLAGRGVEIQVVGGVIYVALGALGGLIYRYLFYIMDWYQRSLGRIAFYSLVFVSLHGLFVGTVITLYIFAISFFAPDWILSLQLQMPKANFLKIIFLSNSINISILQSIWSALYIALFLYRQSLNRRVETLKLENSLKEAQLSTLNNQLNPHFLFNALNNIRFMIRKDAEHAELMLTNLSDLLRYALESSKVDKVSIQQELNVLEHYLGLAQIQFNSRLNYSQEIGEGCAGMLLPPMMLQMLVENAVKHGTDQLKQGGKLQLLVRSADKLEVEVRNEFEPTSSALLNRGFGIGLSNIQQRLELLYGEDASLETKVEGNIWVAVLQIPIEDESHV